MARFAKGDAAAARDLAARHLPRILSHARRVLGDQAEAEDVAQEVIMRIWRIAPDWDAGRAKLSTWAHQVTANLCIDRLRKQTAAPRLPLIRMRLNRSRIMRRQCPRK